MSARSRSERRLIASLAAHTKLARLDSAGRKEATAAARRAFDDTWLKQAREQHPDASEADLQAIAANLKSAHFSRMALRSAQSRRARKATAGRPA